MTKVTTYLGILFLVLVLIPTETRATSPQANPVCTEFHYLFCEYQAGFLPGLMRSCLRSICQDPFDIGRGGIGGGGVGGFPGFGYVDPGLVLAIEQLNQERKNAESLLAEAQRSGDIVLTLLALSLVQDIDARLNQLRISLVGF